MYVCALHYICLCMYVNVINMYNIICVCVVVVCICYIYLCMYANVTYMYACIYMYVGIFPMYMYLGISTIISICIYYIVQTPSKCVFNHKRHVYYLTLFD